LSTPPPIPSSSTVSLDRVTLALRLGWTLAEVYGRLQQDLLFRSTSDVGQRLFLSDLNPTSGERLWVAIQRLAYLHHQLFPPPKASATPAAAGSSAGADPPTALSVAYPAVALDLQERVQRKMLTGRGRLPRPEAVYTELNQWGRQIWAVLDAEDPVLGEAANLGARLADTFWELQFPTRDRQPSAKRTWQHLLRSQRLNATLRQVRQVEAHLPALVGPMLRHSLWE
jgi:hypothetical protein